ncbi:hypothetical protein QBC40DRAFT_285721 [Triangularia verruculosa]|uniref:Uncharacterized protein n=1 Tax=Triangularia verruculosa TaxID=2587418 RepID=A0AAN6XEX1_9PEZI|nr:hypothetical protein QBC40DRAFT_285721 [Triangularia verruculosa]
MPPQTRARATPAAPASRVYESAPTGRQVQFPPRRRNVRTYGRTSTPTGMSRLLRQQTLTQIDYVQQTPPPAELREDEDELPRTIPRAAPKPKKQPRNNRRKTLGDAPASSFHTQTITQMYSMTTKAEEDNELRIKDSEDEGDEDELELPQLSSGRNAARDESPEKKTTRLVLSDPKTPSTKRIKINLDEVPSSQPTPFTPMLAKYTMGSGQSPLKDRSTNVDAPAPTVESVTRRPRDLVIEDSFSPGGGLPSSSSMHEGTPEQTRSSQKRKRQPLAEISLPSMELGHDDNSTEVTPTKKSCREIPDSDDELASISSTPFQTPDKSQGAIGEPGSASQLRYPERVPGSGISNKENRTPRSGQNKAGNSSNDRTKDPGTPTPTNKRPMRSSSQKRQPTRRSSQRLASQRSASKTPVPLTKPSRATGQVDQDGLTTSEDELSELSSTPPKPSSPRAKTPRPRHNLEPNILRSFLRKTTERSAHASPSREARGNTTPQLLTSESSTDHGPTTPTPLRKTVHIQLPPLPSISLGASSGEQQSEEEEDEEEQEIYKETPQKAYRQKSSPFPQRATQLMTQARSQLWTQGWESQRIPLSVIESLGPQTDRTDIVVSIDPVILREIVEGHRDHEFREYRLPPQALRVWLFAADPVNEVKYMAVIGPAKQPGEIDGQSGYKGNAEFNRGETRFRYAYELVQVYRLNNPVPLEDMDEHGMGKTAPARWKYLPPTVVAQLIANLRNAIFLEPGQEAPEAEQFLREDYDEQGVEQGGLGQEEAVGEVEEEEAEEVETQTTTGVTVSQQLERQLTSDIIQSTQVVMVERVGVVQEEEELDYLDDDTVIPASPEQTLPPMPTTDFARPGAPRSSQRIRNQQRPSTPSTVRRVGKTRNMVGLSQASTASNYSSPATSPQKSAGASVPRPHMPGSSELSLPDLDVNMDDDGETQLPVPRGIITSSSQAFATAEDSLDLGMDSGNVRRPPSIIFDSDQE